jgi:hypothetical protein
MKQYKKPVALEVDITCLSIIATSGLRYTNENADKDSEVLAGQSRGEWGNVWK